MSANLYFAYSIKKDFSPPADSNPDENAIKQQRKERKKYIRACDACSIRKTKCDESRPCRNCYSNGLECTELRQRKKMGPKKLRNRTLETIKSLTSNGGKTDITDLKPVADIISKTPDIEAIVRSLVPLTVPSLSVCLPEILNFLRDSASHNADTLEGQAKDAAMSSLALLILAALAEMAKGIRPSPFESHLPHFHTLREYVASTQAEVTRRLLISSESLTTSATHYYLALTELHIYGFFLFRGNHFSVRQIVHLRSAISNFQLIFMSSDSDITGLSELRKTLYAAERGATLFSTEEVFKLSCVVSPGQSSYYTDVPIDTPVLDFCHEAYRLLDNEGIFAKISGIPNLFMWRYVPLPSATGIYGKVKVSIQEMSQLKLQRINAASDSHNLIQLMCISICFKVLLLYAGEYSQTVVSNEILEYAAQASSIVKKLVQSPRFSIYSVVYQLAPQLLEIFKCYCESVNNDIPPEALGCIKDYLQELTNIYSGSPFMDVARLAHETKNIMNLILGSDGDSSTAPSTVASHDSSNSYKVIMNL